MQVCSPFGTIAQTPRHSSSLVSDSYEPHFSLVSLREFGEELVAGRAVSGDFAEGHVLVDPLLCNLVLENAIAHAFPPGLPSGSAGTTV